MLGYPENGVDNLVQRAIPKGVDSPWASPRGVGSPAGGSWGDARQDRDDDELNYALLPRVLMASQCTGFPVKRERYENGKWSCIHIYVIEIILVVCMFGRAWIWGGFPVRLTVILYKIVFMADRLLS